MEIGPRHNRVSSSQDNENFTRYDRRIGDTTYRIVRHWRAGNGIQTRRKDVGIVVYRVDNDEYGEDVVTLVHKYGRSLPKGFE
jgi:hypothetical protein